MTSRDSEPRRSMGPPVLGKTGPEATSSSKRGPNPQTDYKRHFNRTKERFDVVNSDQAIRKKELDRASQKQAKLQEELEYLLDAIAGEQGMTRYLNEAKEGRQSQSVDADEEEEEQREGQDASLSEGVSSAKRQRPSPTDTEDELLETAGLATKRFRDE